VVKIEGKEGGGKGFLLGQDVPFQDNTSPYGPMKKGCSLTFHTQCPEEGCFFT
jgi:hypothetical protein